MPFQIDLTYFLLLKETGKISVFIVKIKYIWMEIVWIKNSNL